MSCSFNVNKFIIYRSVKFNVRSKKIKVGAFTYDVFKDEGKRGLGVNDVVQGDDVRVLQLLQKR